mmetsp:Transcript_45197/g.67135  ORF Transcript_45197/g.67135 Transcript_45197/m.67135 type:complete len:91 (-) Transcript_45197:26-298(-)
MRRRKNPKNPKRQLKNRKKSKRLWKKDPKKPQVTRKETIGGTNGIHFFETMDCSDEREEGPLARDHATLFINEEQPSCINNNSTKRRQVT